jgi:hypothetical protein
MANVLVSFPNSGRTWLQSMTMEIGMPCYYTHQGSHHASKHTIEQIFKFIEKYPNKFDDMDIILLVRDPKDTMVSNYFQTIYRVGIEFQSLSDFLRHPRHGIEKLIKFNLYWKKFHNTKLTISYENLKSNPQQVLIDMCNTFNFPIDTLKIKQSIQNNEFHKMKQREIQASSNAKIYKHTDKTNPESFKIRKGLVGGYIDYMSKSDVEYCDSILNKYNYETEII